MNLFQKIAQMISGFFNQSVSRTTKNNQHLMARGFIEKQKRSLSRLKENKTELIYQRKKMEVRLSKLENQKLALKEDMETAAIQDRDGLALKLMEELENVTFEITETLKSLEVIKNEIEMAKEVEVELVSQIEKSESQLAILMSRMESVKMREQLQSHFSTLHKEISNLRPGLNEIEENILHLESKLETLQGSDSQWKSEVQKMRKERTQYSRQAKLVELKNRMKARQLPGRILSPSTIEIYR